MGNPPWACLRKKDLGWDRGVESKKVVQHVYLVGAKSIYRVAEKDKEYLRDEEEKNQNTAYLLLLGGGELQDTIKSKVEKLNLCDSVIFCGVRTDVNKYLCAMDAFVFPSTWEGLGIVAIEAQASGLECYLSRELPKEVEVTDAVTWFDVSENENAIANMIDIVDYVVNVRDAERFAKLVKSNSVMGFAKFISLALDDWPESDVFQKIAITPPDEELNDSEYYLGLMSRISAIKDIAAVEDVLLEREPIFQRYELELWRRIAIVLTDRGDIRRLYNSGLKYIRFLKEISEKVTIRDEAVDAIEAYCVGLHNAEAVDEYGAFLKKCGELTQLLADNKRIAVICCQNYGRLMHLRLYKNVNAEIMNLTN